MMHDAQNLNYWGMHPGWWTLIILVAMIAVGFIYSSRKRR